MSDVIEFKFPLPPARAGRLCGILDTLTRSRLTSALTFDAPFGTDRVSNDLVANRRGLCYASQNV